MYILTSETKEKIIAIAERYGVERLELFGSANTERFNPETSDIDFLVQFKKDTDLGPWMSKYLEMKEELKELLSYEIDLIFYRTLERPFFAKVANETRKVIYSNEK